MNFWTMGSQHIMVSVCVTWDVVKWNVSAVHNFNALTYSNKERTAKRKNLFHWEEAISPQNTLCRLRFMKFAINMTKKKKKKKSNVNWEKSTWLDPCLSQIFFVAFIKLCWNMEFWIREVQPIFYLIMLSLSGYTVPSGRTTGAWWLSESHYDQFPFRICLYRLGKPH
jgi:hypothetical protein